MRTNLNTAATKFGFSVAGFGLCCIAAYVAGNSGKAPEQSTFVSSNSSIAAPTEPDSTSPSIEEPAAPEELPAEIVPALDPASVAKGKANYDMFCLGCHGPEGNQIDSPSNLFDSKWYSGDGREGVGKSIRVGIMDKGMPGWEAMIPEEDITALLDYLFSFQNPETQTDA
ncbi:c-type cytochrome [Pelagicoccus albus]|uniref:Cytochrome c n=1 Tax=Pelagicoccus albus TaxID=415222 RepID=A0A7X1E875_9BACT|nr:cytochrome c [Pelagicoccus albus]MBC2606515.1 cytochrome c [Pelagicoccus albus]